MARYTRSLTIAMPLSGLHQQVTEVLTACNSEVVLLKDEYIMARENPGQVPFTRLVVVEVLVDNTKATDNATTLTIVVKNEELPLQSNNHCHQMYERLNQAIAEHHWPIVASATAYPTVVQPELKQNTEPHPSIEPIPPSNNGHRPELVHSAN